MPATQERISESRETRPFVFVVDDERLIADTLAKILKRNGFEAMPLHSGEALLEAIETRKPDALLSDVVMGGISGIEVSIRVRKAFPECKIILFSGQSMTNDLLAGARAQGYTFEILSKPVPPKELLAHLNALFAKDGHVTPVEALEQPAESDLSRTAASDAAFHER